MKCLLAWKSGRYPDWAGLSFTGRFVLKRLSLLIG